MQARSDCVYEQAAKADCECPLYCLEKWCKIEEGENLKNELYQSCTLLSRRVPCGSSFRQKRSLWGKFRAPCGKSSTSYVGRTLHFRNKRLRNGIFPAVLWAVFFCQNRELSSGGLGKEISEERLAEVFLELQEQGAANINLVTGEHFVPGILEGLTLAKERGIDTSGSL